MSSVYPPFRLSFMLPDSLAAFVRPGRHCPCLAGCLVTISRGYVAHIDGPTRAQVFAQTRRFLTEIAKDHPPLHIAAELVTDDRHRERGWTIVLGAPVVLTRDWCPIAPPHLEVESPSLADPPVYDGPEWIGAGIENNGNADGPKR
jgi:hypothetical protein